MLSVIRKRMRGGKGFTLIELLVVIIIIAILAAIAIPTFLGQRQKAQDASAKSLVRNAMTAIESAYVDTRSFDPADLDSTILADIEPSIQFTVFSTDDDLVGCATNPTALSKDHAVNYAGVNTSVLSAYAVGSSSESGKTFGVVVNKSAPSGGNTFYIDDAAASW